MKKSAGYIAGFMSKCAECGINAETAVQLMQKRGGLVGKDFAKNTASFLRGEPTEGGFQLGHVPDPGTKAFKLLYGDPDSKWLDFMMGKDTKFNRWLEGNEYYDKIKAYRDRKRATAIASRMPRTTDPRAIDAAKADAARRGLVFAPA